MIPGKLTTPETDFRASHEERNPKAKVDGQEPEQAHQLPAEPKIPTSHDWARNIQAFAEFLLSRPAFEIAYMYPTETRLMTFWSGDKDKFLAAARALGTGKKVFTDHNIEFAVKHEWGTFTITASRSVVCRLVKAAQYECDPFLSPDEEKELGGGA